MTRCTLRFKNNAVAATRTATRRLGRALNGEGRVVAEERREERNDADKKNVARRLLHNDWGLGLSVASDSASIRSRDITVICGHAGVCTLGAVAAKHGGDDECLRYY
ncbi:lanC-like protein [Sesbania bispinosa]|nr:lanC-like protein [Sesbania bispinosa]